MFLLELGLMVYERIYSVNSADMVGDSLEDIVDFFEGLFSNEEEEDDDAKQDDNDEDA